MSNETKRAKVLSHLKSGQTLTSQEAFRWWNVTRLAGDVFELKQRGHVILTEIKKSESGSRYAVYRLVQSH